MSLRGETLSETAVLVRCLSKSTAFVREATGIVRSISPLQAFITTVAVTNIGFGVATTYLPMLAVFPGTNIPLVFVLVLPFLRHFGALFPAFAKHAPVGRGLRVVR
jgi:hypothetical protein